MQWRLKPLRYWCGCSGTPLDGHVTRRSRDFHMVLMNYRQGLAMQILKTVLLVWICAHAKGKIIKLGETSTFCLCQPGFSPVSSHRLKTWRFHWLNLPSKFPRGLSAQRACPVMDRQPARGVFPLTQKMEGWMEQGLFFFFFSKITMPLWFELEARTLSSLA